MRLAMRLPSKSGDGSGLDKDPREGESAEIIDLASRNGFSAVAQRKTKTEGLGLAAGVALVGLLGAVTFWAMNAAELPEPAPAVAAPEPAPAPVPPAGPVVAPAPVTAPVVTPTPVVANRPTTVVGPQANPYASPSLVFDASAAARQATEAAQATATEPVSGSSVGDTGAGGSAAAFASRIGGVGGAPAQARAMVNPSTTVTEGIFFNDMV